MKKRTVIAVLLFFALNASVLNAENLYTIGTKHFDFIYPEECEETALILSESAESLYDKAVSLLQTDIELFIPVYITPYTQRLNAYYTAFPYNRMVFYDTPPDSYSLAVFSNTKLSVFYHELVHAVTMNMKDSFWTFISAVLGDVYSPSYLFSSSLSFLEGATVSFESMDGYGRLNNGDSMSYLIQTKIEDCFPSWKDASGPRDIFPSSQYAYLFGGAFNRYIQNKYGLEKYSELWNLCGSGGGFNPIIDASFKSVYGVSIEDEWNAFIETVPVPSLADDVDVCALSDKPPHSSLFAYRNGAARGLAYLENGSYIRYVTIDEETGLPGKIRTLLHADSYVSGLSFTDDGRYLLITGIGTNLSNSYSLRIYDMEKESYVSDEIYPLSNACIVKLPNGKNVLAGAAVRTGRAYLELRDFDEVLAVSSDATVLYSEKLPVERELYGLCAAGERVWALEKECGEWRVVAYDFSFDGAECSMKRQESYLFPDGIVPSSFVYGGERCGSDVFFCAVAGKGLSTGTEKTPGSLSRLLVVQIPVDGCFADAACMTDDCDDCADSVNCDDRDDCYDSAASVPAFCLDSDVADSCTAPAALLSLGKGDVSGGVHYPFYDAETDTLYFIARKAETVEVSYCKGVPGGLAQLCTVCAVQLDFSVQTSVSKQQLEKPETDLSPNEVTVERTPYNPFKYAFPGSFIPAGIDLTSDKAYILGLTWMLMDPTEQIKLLVSGGWDSFNNCAGISFKTWGGPSFLSYDFSMLTEWNLYGLNKLRGIGVLSGAIPIFTRRQEIRYSDSLIYEYGYSKLLTSEYFYFKLQHHSITNKIKLSYFTEYKTGKSVFDKWSLNAGATFVTECDFINDIQTGFLNNVGFFIDAGVGGFIPLSVKTSFMENSEKIMMLSGDALLLSFEIQKGVPFLPLYANRFTVTGGYYADWKANPMDMAILKIPQLISDYSSLLVKHGVKCGANFTLSPIMSLMYSFQFKFGADFIWYFKNEQNEKQFDLVLCGVFTF